MHIFLYSNWVALSLPIRHAIAHVLDIPKTGPTHVQDDRIVADGYVMETVEAAFDPKNLREKLDADTEDPNELWDLLIARATGVSPQEPEPVVDAPVADSHEQTLEESNAKPEKVKVVKENSAKKVVKKPKK